MTDPTDRPSSLHRRRMLGAGLSVGAAGVTIAIAGGEARSAPGGAENPAEQAKARYRETPHVKRFYDLNRL